MATDTISCVVDRGVALLTLNRPAQLNAITSEMGEAFDRTMVRLSQDRGVRVVVITGAGRGFCAGADAARLSSIASGEDAPSTASASAYEAWTDAPEHFRHRYLAAAAMPQPVIAAVNGPCVGAGLSLAVSCDIRFAGPEASFTALFARRGLIAESGLAWTLPQLVGRGAASDMLLSGRKIEAATALRIGLVAEVMPTDRLMRFTLDYARKIADEVSPRSASIVKSQLWDAAGQDLAAAAERAFRETRACFTTPDFQEAVVALKEKRLPRFADR